MFKVVNGVLLVVCSVSFLIGCGSGSNNKQTPAKPDVEVQQGSAPVIDNIADREYKQKTPIKIVYTVSDPDNDIADKQWTQTTGPETVKFTQQSDDSLQIDFPSLAGSYQFQLEVTDEASHRTTEVVNIDIKQSAFLDWQPCDYEALTHLHDMVECAFYDVHLDWASQSDRKITNLLIRILSPQQPANGNVWYLDGGPGGNARSILENHDIRGNILHGDSYDVYIPIHRGVEGPSRFECSNGINLPTAECFDELMSEYDNQLSFFNLENAARDLSSIIKQTSTPEEKNIVYGGSYGTMWAQKFLQQITRSHDSSLVDGLILDSVVPLDFEAHKMAQNYELVGNRILDICAADIQCREALGGNPGEYLDDTLAKLDEGSCWMINGEQFTAMHGKAVLLTATTMVSHLVPAIIKMMNRCETNDVFGLTMMFEVSSAEDVPNNQPFGSDTNYLYEANGVSANMHRPEFSLREQIELLSILRFFPVYPKFFELADIWPVEATALDSEIPKTDMPILMVNGDLDPQTTDVMATAARDNIKDDNVTLVIFPTLIHGVIHQQFMLPDHNCIPNLFRGFIDNPEQTPNATCARSSHPLDVNVKSEYWQEQLESFTGMRNPW